MCTVKNAEKIRQKLMYEINLYTCKKGCKRYTAIPLAEENRTCWPHDVPYVKYIGQVECVDCGFSSKPKFRTCPNGCGELYTKTELEELYAV